jgi:hypothetical protein
MTPTKLIAAISSAHGERLDYYERRAAITTMSEDERRAVKAAIKTRRDYLNSQEYLLTLARTI